MIRCLSCDAPNADPALPCASCGASAPMREGFLHFAPNLADGFAGFDRDHFARLAAMADDHFWFAARNRVIVDAVARSFPEAASFFEIGCGTAAVLSAVRGAYPSMALAGSEIYTAGLAFARERMGETTALYQMDARAIPFREEFDLIGIFDVLEHIEDDRTVLGQIHAALKPGGGIIVTVPQHPSLWSGFDDFSCHVRRYDRADLATKMIDAGFTIERTTSFMTLLLPLVAASRLWNRISGAPFDPDRETRPGKLANTLFSAITGAETGLIRTGLSLPWGVSLLMVGRKA